MVKKKCCLSFNRDLKYYVDYILNSRENLKRGALKAKETKAGKKISGVLRNVLILFCPDSYFQGSADQESYLRNENFSQLPVKACKE